MAELLIKKFHAPDSIYTCCVYKHTKFENYELDSVSTKKHQWIKISYKVVDPRPFPADKSLRLIVATGSFCCLSEF
jgi:hypothetical protein